MRNYKYYCDEIENVENYDKALADGFKGWECHHRLETHFSDGTPRPKNAQLTYKELIALGTYWNRPANELIFLTTKEHRSLHKKGKQLSEETKIKLSEAHKGKKLEPFSEEHRRKIGEAHKGKSTWTKEKHHSEETRKKISEAHKGKPTWNKGKHHSEETLKKISEAGKGKHWYNDGTKSIMSKTCPEGFVPGRINYVR